jgi:hypothetical protein
LFYLCTRLLSNRNVFSAPRILIFASLQQRILTGY